jgi:hypothetical protein
MPALDKILWTASYGTLDEFLGQAANIGATGVAIRTDNDVAAAIPAAHARGMQIYGWRWPSVVPDDAMAQADAVVTLLDQGLDGYFVDPERSSGLLYDWDQPGLEPLADEFCGRITAAAGDRLFGVTSHYRAAEAYPDIPWKTFFHHASVLLPQCYWRSNLGKIGPGNPAANYITGIDAWARAGAKMADIIPMAGELAMSTADEITAYAAAAASRRITTLHYYCYNTDVPPSVWSAVAAS